MWSTEECSLTLQRSLTITVLFLVPSHQLLLYLHMYFAGRCQTPIYQLLRLRFVANVLQNLYILIIIEPWKILLQHTSDVFHMLSPTQMKLSGYGAFFGINRELSSFLVPEWLLSLNFKPDWLIFEIQLLKMYLRAIKVGSTSLKILANCQCYTIIVSMYFKALAS